ncbi:TetR/AcrR family transcriptional regulator [Bacillus sp. AFS055030]|uniref:TetR/AcrR family transcriptional regulator n=1 Tax=Bacillus sp. AFS055030 TaxID=2033507 RepID=UPI000BFCCDA0|nr:TetR/AcrR family transcriptional regulator [Bacillus sp. AFS055030]PGL70702.1 TetR family transcriptional regulator [Bacillus sp. AFS055030]
MARSKEFEVDAVLLKAMRLFWEQGYEKTSMQDLVSHMGIHKGSMYDTFGDKQSLYFKSLERYIEFSQQTLIKELANTRSAKEAIQVFFELSIDKQEELPTGCLIVNTAVELAKHDLEARDWVLQSWGFTEQLIHDIILEGQRMGELSKKLDAKELSYYFINAIIGFRVMVKTDPDREKLRKIMEINLSVLDN